MSSTLHELDQLAISDRVDVHESEREGGRVADRQAGGRRRTDIDRNRGEDRERDGTVCQVSP